MLNRSQELLNHFKKIDHKKPSDFIIEQFRDLISAGVLKPGNRLPSERRLAMQFNIGRGHVREAIKKLEFYGILTTRPQSGTYVASLGVAALNGLLANVLELGIDDWDSLIETRSILETQAAGLAAMRIHDTEIAELEAAHATFAAKVAAGDSGLEEDLLFHLKLAEYARNPVLRSLISLITPDVLTYSKNLGTCREGRSGKALREHERILKAIRLRDPDGASTAMAEHMEKTLLPNE